MVSQEIVVQRNAYAIDCEGTPRAVEFVHQSSLRSASCKSVGIVSDGTTKTHLRSKTSAYVLSRLFRRFAVAHCPENIRDPLRGARPCVHPLVVGAQRRALAEQLDLIGYIESVCDHEVGGSHAVADYVI